jgi:hypothetical protein
LLALQLIVGRSKEIGESLAADFVVRIWRCLAPQLHGKAFPCLQPLDLGLLLTANVGVDVGDRVVPVVWTATAAILVYRHAASQAVRVDQSTFITFPLGGFAWTCSLVPQDGSAFRAPFTVCVRVFAARARQVIVSGNPCPPQMLKCQLLLQPLDLTLQLFDLHVSDRAHYFPSASAASRVL